MRIVMINGSPRKNGSTGEILEIVKNYLEEKEDVEIEYFHLQELEISFCKGCCNCFKNGKCFIDDDAEDLSRIISEADGVIVGSPTYASNISGQLKVFVDRGHLIIEQLLYRKYAMGVITGENYGASTAAKILKNIFLYSGAYISGSITHKLPFSSRIKFGDNIERDFQEKSEKFYQDIKSGHTYAFQKFIHKIVFNVGIKPFVLKKGSKYQGVLEHWGKNNII
ncbi:flavodoxin family protein [Clostridium paraputrificum]|uniref:flavodoxin family protein n=1 Tax=Clostridium paraputrificum TaxID=29363 RepID=UPI003D338E2E